MSLEVAFEEENNTNIFDKLIEAINSDNSPEAESIISLISTEDLNDPTKYQANLLPIHTAIIENNFVIVQALIQKGSDVKLSDDEGNSSISLAVNSGNLEMIHYLIKQGASFDEEDSSGYTPLMAAVKDGNYQIVRSLLEHGARAFYIAQSGQNSLTLAAKWGKSEILELLLDYGASTLVNEVHDSSEQTALWYAAKLGKLEAVKSLLKNGASGLINKPDQNGYTPLMVAKNAEIAALLIENGAQTNLVAKDGKTALSIASAKGIYDLVKLLLTHDTDSLINEVDVSGNTALGYAALNNHSKIVNLLVRHGAETDHQNPNSKKTILLDTIVSNGASDTVRELIACGANICLLDKNDKDALCQANLHNLPKVIKWLHFARQIDLEFASGDLYVENDQQDQDIASIVEERMKFLELKQQSQFCESVFDHSEHCLEDATNVLELTGKSDIMYNSLLPS